MEINKIRELALANGFSLKEQASGNMDLHSYVYEFANALLKEATPEGFVLVHKELPEEIAEAMAKERVSEPREENDPVWLEIAKDAYKSQIMSKKWELWRDYKAMIEAQEQSHD